MYAWVVGCVLCFVLFLNSLIPYLSYSPVVSFPTYLIPQISHSLLTLFPSCLIPYLFYSPVVSFPTYSIPQLSHSLLILFLSCLIPYLFYSPVVSFLVLFHISRVILSGGITGTHHMHSVVITSSKSSVRVSVIGLPPTQHIVLFACVIPNISWSKVTSPPEGKRSVC